MKLWVGGVRIDLGWRVAIFDIRHGSLPKTYHAVRTVKTEDGFEERTDCGLAVAYPAVILSPRTATRFGRPCRRCWLALRSVRPLWEERELFR